MNKNNHQKKIPFIIIIFLLFIGFIFGTTQLLQADSWINGTSYIYPNGSWNNNVNVSGNFTVDGTARVMGKSICLSDGTNCAAISNSSTSISGDGWVNDSQNVWLSNNNTNVSIGNSSGYASNIFIDTANSRLGINNNRPTNALHLVSTGTTMSVFDTYATIPNSGAMNLRRARGSNSSPLAVIINDTVANFQGSSYNGTSFNNIAAVRMRVDDNSTPAFPGGKLEFLTAYNVTGNNNIHMVIDQHGRIGINTTNPLNTLDLIGGQLTTALSASVIPLQLRAAAGQTADLQEWQNSAGQTLDVISANGNVGIGTPSPVVLADVIGTPPSQGVLRVGKSITDTGSSVPVTIATANYLQIGGREFTTNSLRLIGFGYNSGGSAVSPASIGFIETDSSANTMGDLLFLTRAVTTSTVSPSIRMRITNTGNVGINTNTPSTLLDVNGTVNATSLYLLGNKTASIGGGLLTAGSCTSSTTTIEGVKVGQVSIANPETYPGDGAEWESYISSNNIVTVKVCALVALTPTASVYQVRVIQ